MAEGTIFKFHNDLDTDQIIASQYLLLPNLEEMKDLAENKPGFIKAMWCGCQECEDAMKEEVGVTSRCIPFEQEEFADTCVYCGKPAKKMVYWGKAY